MTKDVVMIAIFSTCQRGLEILRGIALGQTSIAIADRLFISYRTVETHRSNLLRKFEAKNSIQLINRAKQLKLV
jgi:DNA-binding NarL/FixJ family response regulator